MSMTSESDEMLMHKNDVDSRGVDDSNSEENVGPNINGQLKKGPWTSAEDAILVEYVTKHGEGNWNALMKHSGLARCGKSCRLRWANHLRPDLKKGAFSPEEEHLIIELHAKMGNKWARMAAELPGRTDNEIKNFWNTRIKRRQRAGLPIYPPDLCLQSLNETQQNNDMNTVFSCGDQDFMPVNNNFEVEFKNFELNHHLLYPAPAFHSYPASNNLIPQGSYRNTSLFSTMHHPPKRLRGSEPIFPSLNNTQYQNDGSFVGSHAGFLNGNPCSSSGPGWATKVELPSLQTQTGRNSWGGSPSSPLPSLETVDILIQNPPTEQQTRLSRRNSGLLDAVLYESQTMNTFRNGSTSWEAAYGEQMSPFGHSCSSVFSEGTPISRNSFDEPESVEPGCKVKEEVPMQYGDKANETRNKMIYSRPDFLLGSDW